MDWKKGDIAICIENGALDKSDSKYNADYYINNPLAIRLDAEYIVHSVYTCPRCNNSVLDIGIANYGVNIMCDCGENIPCKEIRWFNEKRFKKKIKKKSEFPFLDDEDIFHV